MQKNTILSATAVAIIVLLGVLFVAFQRGVLYFADGNPVPQFSLGAITNPVPDLDRESNFPADFSPEAKTLYRQNIEKLTAALRANTGNYEAWLDMAIYYRMVGDHEGALEVWNYVSKKFPEDGVSKHNLAEYYFRTVKDYKKAERYYLDSIRVSPQIQSNYTDLYDMYRYSFKTDTSAAVDILVQGIAVFNSSERIDLKVLLGRHYKEILNDRDNAIKYLTEARNDAIEIGDLAIAEALDTEIKAL